MPLQTNKGVADSRPSGTLYRVVVKANPEPVAVHAPQLFLNRELSLLAFQRRVLEEAQDPRLPLLERLKFLAIVSSNLNEFFMVRVAGLLGQAAAGVWDASTGDWSPTEQLRKIRAEVVDLLEQSDACLVEVLAKLADQGVRVAAYSELSTEQKASASSYFLDKVLPALTPLAFDPSRPFPHISNHSLNLAVMIQQSESVERFARIKVPERLPRLVPVGPEPEDEGGEKTYIWLEQLIAANLHHVFRGLETTETHVFHVIRDAEMAIQEIEADDLLETIAEGVQQRRFGSVVMLGVQRGMPERILSVLKKNLEISDAQVYQADGPLALERLMSLYSIGRPDLKFPPHVPRIPKELEGVGQSEDELARSSKPTDIFQSIRREDILLHHPYDSFEPVVDFIRKAAHDPNVIAIKMTLYRVGRNSPIVEALFEAQEEGKQVVALLELKARFDEESNIGWARKLEERGVHVVYGFPKLKIHSKVALVVRQEGDELRRYVHLSTGNYNSVTAQLYTDIGLFTCDEDIASDATELFNHLTGYVAEHSFKKLWVAPFGLRQHLEELILREIQHARSPGVGRLIFKTNGLIDRHIIDLLYEASQAGVRCDLLVRGICTLRPGLPGVSENIRVISIVGRFLEHSRIYYFGNGGQEEMYLGSADLMPRNLDSRVETVFPIRNPEIQRYLRDDVLNVYLSDNAQARFMDSDGTYCRAIAPDGKLPTDSQMLLARKPR